MPKINYDIADLRALFELAAQGGFNRAADVLAITPSALSKRIAKIEASVGGRVVERTTRAMELTTLGKLILSRAEPLLHALDDCMEGASRVAHGLEGQISVGCIATVAFSQFPIAVARFIQDFPNVRINLRDGEGSHITAAVLNHEVEFAVTTVLDNHRDLIAEKVGSDPFVLVCPPNHPLAELEAVQWEQLKSWKIMGFKLPVSSRKLIDQTLAECGIELSWFYEVGILSSFLGYLKSGQFIAPVPKLLAGFVPHLRTIPLEGPRVERGIYLVRRERQLSVPANVLWDALVAVLGVTGNRHKLSPDKTQS